LISIAKVYTVDSPRWAEAVVIDEGGSIVAVGPEPSVLSRYSTASEYDYVDMEQRLIIPGFQDAHVHAVEAGINAKICYVYEYSWIEDIPHAFRARHCPRGGTFVTSPIEKGKSLTSSSSSPRLRPTGTALGFMLSTILYMYIYVVSVEK
jgi:hypothetical protein